MSSEIQAVSTVHMHMHIGVAIVASTLAKAQVPKELIQLFHAKDVKVLLFFPSLLLLIMLILLGYNYRCLYQMDAHLICVDTRVGERQCLAQVNIKES
jgi:hypothetical protein